MIKQGEKKYDPSEHPVEVVVGKPSPFIVGTTKPLTDGEERMKLKRKYLAKSGNPSTNPNIKVK